MINTHAQKKTCIQFHTCIHTSMDACMIMCVCIICLLVCSHVGLATCLPACIYDNFRMHTCTNDGGVSGWVDESTHLWMDVKWWICGFMDLYSMNLVSDHI